MKPHEGWLRKSLRDLETAKVSFKNDDPLLDTAIYHTQQCAEKILRFIKSKIEELDSKSIG